MLKIGLTGGIGSGKSTVCRLFAEFGITIVDADLIARQLVAPGQPALTRIVEAFGARILATDGSLNRPMLRERICQDSKAKQILDSILHPLIFAEISAALARLEGPYGIAAIPLLVESGRMASVDRVLVIDCPESVQLQRVMERDRQTQQQALAMMANQASREQRRAVADDIIDNAGSPTQLAEQVKSLHNSYLLLATARKLPA